MDLISAEIIYDGHNLNVPDRMLPNIEGDRKSKLEKVYQLGQLLGTTVEKLCELAGRNCYDSLGAGRPSVGYYKGDKWVEGYHEHIIKVGHTSVLAHANITFEVKNVDKIKLIDLAYTLQKFPGIWTEIKTDKIRVTINLRSIVDLCELFDHAYVTWISKDDLNFDIVKSIMLKVGHAVAPEIVKNTSDSCFCDIDIVEPITEEECWVTMLLTGSRGFSHEDVRHGYRTALSQRSTRYVDENNTPWIIHPLLKLYNESEQNNLLKYKGENICDICRHIYGSLTDNLQKWLINRGVNRTTSRKQARGVARGYLGNALYTEVVHSASIAQFKRMIIQRASGPADAEIREVYVKVFDQLKQSRYGHFFEGWKIESSEDGIGQIVVKP
jgi:thymidylate synthase ThyX